MSGIQQLMAGGGGVVFTPVQGSGYSESGVGSTASSSLTVITDGRFVIVGSSSGNTNGDWAKPTDPGYASNFWVRATKTAGTTPTGSAVGSWLFLNVNQVWTLSATNGGASCTLTIEIAKDAAGTNIVAACTGSVSISYGHV